MSDDFLRIGDREREQAATELGEHYAQGRLSSEEHSERLDRIWAARTRSDLAANFGDLPGAFGPQRTRRTEPRRATVACIPGRVRRAAAAVCRLHFSSYSRSCSPSPC